MDCSNFHTEDNDLQFTSTWELPHLPKSTESHLYQSVDFISGLTFWNRTYSYKPQNLRSYDILHDHVALETKPWQYFKQFSKLGSNTLYKLNL